MIFQEIYGVYYNVVAKILTEASDHAITGQEMSKIIERYAFEESFLKIAPALKEGKWELLTPKGCSILGHAPTLPLTTLQKRWLKSVMSDRRINLFGVKELPQLEEVEPLFTEKDFYVYDRFNDGDNYSDPQYIANFSIILQAMREERLLTVHARNKKGGKMTYKCIPYKLEYSGKDDKFRLDHIHNGRRFYLNLRNILSCELGEKTPLPLPMPERKYRNFVLELNDRRNALERAMIAFGHYKKEVVKEKEGTYTVKIYYDEQDKTELLINVLSFGPMVFVKSPARFQKLVQERLEKQARLWKM